MYPNVTEYFFFLEKYFYIPFENEYFFFLQFFTSDMQPIGKLKYVYNTHNRPYLSVSLLWY